MDKRKTLMILYVGLLAFFSVFVWYKIQERYSMILLDNHNLSSNAVLVTAKNAKTRSVASFEKQVEQAGKLTDMQVHFQLKKNSAVTYFYGKGDFSTPSMTSGKFFADQNFTATVPIAVVGKTVAKKLYTPKDQSYLKLNGSYVPVIGVMGSKYKSNLDDQIFIAASPDYTKNIKLSQVRVWLDSIKPVSNATLKATLGLTAVTKTSVTTLNHPHDSKLKHYLLQILGLLLITILALVTVPAWIATARRDFASVALARVRPSLFVFRQWEFYTLFCGLGLLFGGLAGSLVFHLLTYVSLLAFGVFLFLVVSTTCYFGLKRRFHVKSTIRHPDGEEEE